MTLFLVDKTRNTVPSKYSPNYRIAHDQTPISYFYPRLMLFLTQDY